MGNTVGDVVVRLSVNFGDSDSKFASLGKQLESVSSVASGVQQGLQGLARGLNDAAAPMQEVVRGLGEVATQGKTALAGVVESVSKLAAGTAQAVPAVQNLSGAISDNAAAFKVAGDASMTWKEFVKANMTEAMKALGSHGAAMKEIGRLWQEMKDQGAAAGATIQQVGTSIQSTGKAAADIVKPLFDLNAAEKGAAETASEWTEKLNAGIDADSRFAESIAKDTGEVQKFKKAVAMTQEELIEFLDPIRQQKGMPALADLPMPKPVTGMGGPGAPSNPYEFLKVETTQGLQEMARFAEQAYNQITASGTASARDLQLAWVSMEEKRIAAAKAAGQTITAEEETLLAKVKDLAGQDPFSQLGVTSKRALEQAAEQARASYDYIASRGTSTARDIQAAWIIMEERRQAAAVASGKIISQEETRILNAAKSAAGLTSIEAAFTQLGMRSTSTLRQTANEAKNAFDMIRSAGTASAQDILQAWINMEQRRQVAAIAAGQVISQQEAKILASAQSLASVKAVEQAFTTLGTKSSAALNSTAAAAREAFNTILNSGKATPEVIAAAFQTMQSRIAQYTAAGNAGIAANYQQLGQTLTALSSQLMNVGLAMSAAVTAPLAALGGGSVKAAADFELGMRRVTSLLGEVTEHEFKRLSDATLEVSRRIGIDAVKATDALYQAISAGVPKENAVEFLAVASTAAIAGVTDTKVAVDALTTVLNAYHLEAAKTREVSDAMFMAVNIGKFTFEQLAASMGKTSGFAAQIGISFQEILAAAATITKAGFTVSQAMTQIQAAMKALVAPNAEMNKLIEQTGFKTGEAMLMTLGFEGSLQALREAAKGNTTEMEKAFGRIEGFKGLLALTGANAKGAAQDFDKTMRASEGVGAAMLAANEINKSARREWEQLSVRIKDARIELGQALLPVMSDLMQRLSPLVELLRDAVRQFAALPVPVRALAVEMGALAALTGPAMLAVAGLTRGLAPLIPLLGGASSAAGGLAGSASTLTPILARLGTAAGIVAEAFIIFRQLQEVKEHLENAARGLNVFQSAVQTTVAPLNEFAKHTHDIVNLKYDGVKLFTEYLRELRDALTNLGPGIGLFVQLSRAIEYITRGYKDMGPEVGKARDRMQGLADEQSRAMAAAVGLLTQEEKLNVSVRQAAYEYQKATEAFVQHKISAAELALAYQKLQRAREEAAKAGETPLTKQFEDAKKKLAEIREAFSLGFGTQKDVDDAMARVVEAFQRLHPELTYTGEGLKGVGKALKGIPFAEASRDNAALVEQVRLLAQESKKLEDQSLKLKDKIRDEQQAYHDASLVEAGMTEGLSAARLEAAYAVIAFLNLQSQIDSGRLGFEKAHTSVKELATALQTTSTQVKTIGEGFKEMAKQGAESMKSLPPFMQLMMSDALRLKGPLIDAADAWGRLGAKSQEELDSIANQAIKDFEAIRQVSATSTDDIHTSTLEIQRAWIAMIEKVIQAGRTLPPEIARAFQEIKELVSGDPFKALRIRSQAELEGLANAAIRAYEQIKVVSGQTWVQTVQDVQHASVDIQRAWVAMVGAQIEAGRQLPPEMLAVYERLKTITASATRDMAQKWRDATKIITQGIAELSQELAMVLMGGGRVNTQRLRDDADAAKASYDSVVKSATDAVDQQQDVKAAFDAWQKIQRQLDLTDEKAAVAAAKAIYDDKLAAYKAGTATQQDVTKAYYDWMAAQRAMDRASSSDAQKALKQQADDAKANYEKIRQAALDLVPAQKEVIDAYKQMTDAEKEATHPGLWNRFRDTVLGIFEDIGRAITKYMILKLLETHGIIDKLTGALDAVLGKVFGLLGLGGGGGGGAIGAGMSAAASGVGNILGLGKTAGGLATPPILGPQPGNMPNLGPIGGTGPGSVASAGGPAASTATSAAGGLLGTISSVAGIVGAISSVASGIVSGIQQAHANTLLARIEESTRYLKIGIVEGYSAVGLAIGLIRDRITDIQLSSFGVVIDLLGQINDNLKKPGVGTVNVAASVNFGPLNETLLKILDAVNPANYLPTLNRIADTLSDLLTRLTGRGPSSEASRIPAISIPSPEPGSGSDVAGNALVSIDTGVKELARILTDAHGELVRVINNSTQLLLGQIHWVGQVTQGPMGQAGQWITAGGSVLGSVLGAVGGKASAAIGGAVSAAMSSVTGIIGAGAGVLSGIVSGIQGAHTNTLLGRIEESTRYLKIGLVDGYSAVGLAIAIIRDRITDIQTSSFGVVIDLLGQINDALKTLKIGNVNITAAVNLVPVTENLSRILDAILALPSQMVPTVGAAAGMPALAAAGGGDIHLHFHGPVMGGQAAARELADYVTFEWRRRGLGRGAHGRP